MGIQVREILGRTLPLSLVVKDCDAQDTRTGKIIHAIGIGIVLKRCRSGYKQGQGDRRRAA